MSMKSLLPYWPTLESVRACISAEAETSSNAIFLAAHQPMKFECKREGGGQETEFRDERALLEAFMEDAPPEGRVILPIVGSSGVGKSHVVRWLDVQLQRHPRREHLHIIRIPKGSSLKGVLRLILDGLPGTAYAPFRKKLNEAHEQLDPELAAKMLLTNLRHLLVKASAAATERLTANRSLDPEHDKLLKAFGVPRALPAFLGDPILETELFLGTTDKPGIVSRLAEHVTREGGSDVDQRAHQFEASDFRVRDEFVRQMNAQAKDFYRLIAKEGDQHRVQAARLLNDLLDQAKQELLRLGDNTLTELFVDVRAQLFKEGKELILLVEDFAVLSGLQGALLDVMIREAYRDGKQVLCTIRSALAYTEGYLMKATVRTRARIEWRIPEKDNDVVSRAVELVGGYLNAARLGRDHLTDSFNTRAARSGGEWSAGWVPRFEHELDEPGARVLEAFGTSTQGHPLFPFNRTTIERLVATGSQGPDGRPLFNPRNIINNVLRETLGYRPEFERGEFPAETFGTTESLTGDALAEIRRLQPSHWKRYARVAAYWGTAPQVFQAFGLSALSLGGAIRVEEPRSPSLQEPVAPVGPKPSTKQPKVSAQASKIQEWDQKLKEWHGGKSLSQTDARILRNWIAHRVMAFIPWPLHSLQPPWEPTRVAEKLFLPGGSQADTTEANAIFIVCTQHEREDEQASLGIRNALLAIIRHEEYGREWNYEGAERDSARVAQFLTDRVARTLDAAREQADELITPMVEVLLVGARCLGAKVGPTSDRAALVEALFENLKPPALGPHTRRLDWLRWDSVLEKSASLRRETQTRPSAQDILLQQVGARQGELGKDTFALDVVRLLPALESVKKSWSITSLVNAPTSSKTLRVLANDVSALKMELQPAAKKLSEELLELRRTSLTFLGETFDRDEIRTVFSELVKSTSDLGVVPGMDPQVLREAIKSFYDSPVKGVLDQLARLETEKAPGQTLGVLAQLDRPALLTIESVIEQLTTFLKNASAAIKSNLDASGSDPVETARNALVDELETIERHLRSLRETSS